MSAQGTRFVIIGNGVAGMEAALLIKQRDARADVTIISEESDHHFSRTALMWIHAGQLSHRDTEPLERDAYARLGIRRVRARCVGVDVEGKRVRLAGELSPIAYDVLLVACGSRPRPAPFEGASLRGVGHFVTHQDLAWLEEELFGSANRIPPPNPRAHLAATTADSPYHFRRSASQARGRPSSTPAIIGGGLIGVEAVELAVARGLRPHFFLRDEWFWPIAIDANESDFIAKRLSAHGVTIHTRAKVKAVAGDEAGLVRAVVTDTEEVPCDCVVVAIGVLPNTEWLRGTDITLDAHGAIEVDEAMRTSAPDVFAAGDCAAVPYVGGGKRTELLWYTGRDQGRVAARSMLGEHARYERGPWYNSAKLMDVEYTTVGLVNVGVEDERNWYFEERGAVSSTLRIVLSGDRIVGVNALGRRWDNEVLIDFIRNGRSLAFVLDHLHEASFDTELVPKLVVPASDRARPALPSAPPEGRSPIPVPSW